MCEDLCAYVCVCVWGVAGVYVWGCGYVNVSANVFGCGCAVVLFGSNKGLCACPCMCVSVHVCACVHAEELLERKLCIIHCADKMDGPELLSDCDP